MIEPRVCQLSRTLVKGTKPEHEVEETINLSRTWLGWNIGTGATEQVEESLTIFSNHYPLSFYSEFQS